MCVKRLAQISGVLPTEGENDDSYKNPGSGQADPQWKLGKSNSQLKLGVNIRNPESTQDPPLATPSEPTTEGGTQRSEVSG
mgnify:CR=1 FL=1